ncbi:MAG TPA: L-rhamnose/proton symporter RhaT [Terriglobia bacterium]|nr:L-rhamnose/proton symporter RhaT [Terriglobia bacterium]
MAGHFSLGMAVILVSGVFNGAFPLPMKMTRGWNWENTWLAFSVAAVLLLPWLLAAVFVPHLAQVYSKASRQSIEYPALFGFLWGIAQVTFGIGIDAVGMAVAIAVVSGLGALSGALVPLLVLHPEDIFRPRGIFLLVGLPVLLVGIFLYGKAGRLRERDVAGSRFEPGASSQGFMKGLAICLFTGIFASNFNLGFAFSDGLPHVAIMLGATPARATYAVWAIVFTAGFLPNLIYCAYLLSRHHTWRLFASGDSLRNLILSLAMAALWVTGVFGYGVGATVAGNYGTSIGFTLFMASSILSSNVIGLWSGEWRMTTRVTRRILTAGIIMILLSVVVLNLPGLLV